jgi:hypothetical protein
MRMRALLLIVAVCAWQGQALGQRGEVNLTPPPLPAESDGALRALSPTTLAPGSCQLNLWATYANQPVVLADAAGRRRFSWIGHRVLFDQAFAIGLLPRLEGFVAVPVVAYQGGDRAEDFIGQAQLSRTALGNVEVGYKTTWLGPGDFGGALLGSRVALALPTGSREANASTGSPEGDLALLAGMRLLVAELRLRFGVRLSEERMWVQRAYGSELRGTLGAVLRPSALGLDQQGRVRFAVEYSWAAALADRATGAYGSSLEFGFAHRFSSWSALGALGVPTDDRPGNPRFSLTLGVGWHSDE